MSENLKYILIGLAGLGIGYWLGKKSAQSVSGVLPSGTGVNPPTNSQTNTTIGGTPNTYTLTGYNDPGTGGAATTLDSLHTFNIPTSWSQQQAHDFITGEYNNGKGKGFAQIQSDINNMLF